MHGLIDEWIDGINKTIRLPEYQSAIGCLAAMEKVRYQMIRGQKIFLII